MPVLSALVLGARECASGRRAASSTSSRRARSAPPATAAGDSSRSCSDRRSAASGRLMAALRAVEHLLALEEPLAPSSRQRREQSGRGCLVRFRHHNDVRTVGPDDVLPAAVHRGSGLGPPIRTQHCIQGRRVVGGSAEAVLLANRGLSCPDHFYVTSLATRSGCGPRRPVAVG